MNLKVDRGKLTRDGLIATARVLFAEHGYDGASVEGILERADVSRGALYHHFTGKEDLFVAVLEDLYNSIDVRVHNATQGQSSAAAALRIGCLEWIRIASDPAVGRTLLIDAPAVLGWRRWRQMDEARTLTSIRTALDSAAQHGALAVAHVDYFAHALLASMNEVALMIAESANPGEAALRAEDAIGELFRRILSPPAAFLGDLEKK